MFELEAERRELLGLDAATFELGSHVRLFSAVTPDNAESERGRILERAREGVYVQPEWRYPKRRLPSGFVRSLDTLRKRAAEVPLGHLYMARLDELELEAAMFDSLGDARRLRPLAARRYGTGMELVRWQGDRVPVLTVALELLEDGPAREEAVLPAFAEDDTPSFCTVILEVARRAGLSPELRHEPRLAATIAAGDGVLYLSGRPVGRAEAVRLAIHEVLGHLISAAHAKAQPLRLFELGTADSFADQEGIAVALEESAGCLSKARLRTLAARAVATRMVHDGAHPAEALRDLIGLHGVDVEDAVLITERAFRGGGLARDVGYLSGWLRVRQAIDDSAHPERLMQQMRIGRVSLSAIAALPEMTRLGLVSPLLPDPLPFGPLAANPSDVLNPLL